MKLRNKYFNEAADGTGVGESTGAGSVAGAEAPSSDVNWDHLDNEFDRLNEATEENPFVDTPPPAVEPKVTATPAEATPPQTPAPVQPAVVPPVEAAPVAPVTPETPVVAEPQVPATPQPSREEMRVQYVSQLETQYALDEASAQMMITEPEKVLPKLAAQMHVNIVDTVIAAVMGNLPSVINAIQSQAKTSSEAEDAFFQAWPQLKNDQHKKTVYDAVAAHRTLNPRATREEIIRSAGLQALIQLRLPIPPELMPQAPQATPSSFTPAAPGSGAMPPAHQQQDSNPFVQLSQEFLRDD